MVFDSSNKVVEIKAELSRLGLSTHGRKAELLERLNEHLNSTSTQEFNSKSTVKELKEELRKRKLSVSGRKAELIARLNEAANDGESEEKETPKASPVKRTARRRRKSKTPTKSPEKTAPTPAPAATTSTSTEEDSNDVDSGDLLLCTSLIMLAIVVTGYHSDIQEQWGTLKTASAAFNDGPLGKAFEFLNGYFPNTSFLVLLSVFTFATSPLCSFYRIHYTAPVFFNAVIAFLMDQSVEAADFANCKALFLVFVHSAFVWTIAQTLAKKIWSFYGNPKDLSVYEFNEPLIAQFLGRAVGVVGACLFLEARYSNSIVVYVMVFVVIYHTLVDFCKMIM